MRKQLIDEYSHNQYITSLPERLNERELLRRLTHCRPSTPEERASDPILRKQMIQRMDEYMMPLPVSGKLFELIDDSLIKSYRYRSNADGTDERFMNTNKPVTTAPSITVTGPSGCGKTTLITAELSTYPKCQTFESDGERDVQIVWLKIEIASNSGPKPFYRSIFQSIDNVLGTNYYDQYSSDKRKLEELARAARQLLATYHVGVLFIDEAQNLVKIFNNDMKALSNEMTNFLNQIQTAVIFCGTDELKKFFTNAPFHSVRRMASEASVRLEPLEGEVWRSYLNGLWRYQYTNVKTPLSDDLRDMIYRYSLGVPDTAKKIYALTQRDVIGREDETITPDDIQYAAESMLGPVIQNLRRGYYEA